MAARLPWEIGGGGPLLFSLLSGGTFTRGSEGSYQTGAPTDGTTAFLAWAANNVPRVDDRGDGLAGLLLEGSRTNVLTKPRDVTDATGWPSAGSGGTVTAGQANSPDGSSSATRCQFSSAGFTKSKGALVEPAAFSQWAKTINGNPYGTQMGTPTNPRVWMQTNGIWRRDAADDGNGIFTPVWYGTGIAAAIDVHVDLCQYEQAARFPSSAIRTGGGTRAADILTYATGTYPTWLLSGGFRCVVALDASSADIVAGNTDHRIAHVGTNDFLRFRKNTNCVLDLVCGGSVAASLTLTFSRYQALTITAKPAAGTLTVSGAATGNGTASGTGAAWASGQTLYVGADNTGTDSLYGRIVGSTLVAA
jgi:hypothetical protein